MCILCAEFAKGNLNISEVREALKELLLTAHHLEQPHYEQLDALDDEDLEIVMMEAGMPDWEPGLL
jgi:hypothetical protein